MHDGCIGNVKVADIQYGNCECHQSGSEIHPSGERFTEFQSEVNKKFEIISRQEKRGSGVDLQSRTNARVRLMMENAESISGPQRASSSPSQPGDKAQVEPMATGRQGDGSTVGTPVKTTVDVSSELRKTGATG